MVKFRISYQSIISLSGKTFESRKKFWSKMDKSFLRFMKTEEGSVAFDPD